MNESPPAPFLPIITSMVNAGTFCPTQWEMQTSDGHYVYARYRGGRLRAEWAKSEIAWWNHDGIVSLYSADVGEPLDGSMSDGEMKVYLGGVLDFSKLS